MNFEVIEVVVEGVFEHNKVVLLEAGEMGMALT